MHPSSPDLPDLFCRVLEFGSLSERENFIRESTLGNEELAAQLKSLLSAHQAAKGLVAETQPGMVSSAPQERSAAKHESVMPSLSNTFGVSSLRLKESAPNESCFMVKPDSIHLPREQPGSKYQFCGEIARGGMGAILHAFDLDLGRSVAVKVLLESHKENPRAVQRFVEEAQIAGQLQHPGIAPIYQTGEFSDGRPYFAMKLVNGKTLASILSARKSLRADRSRLLGIFEQVCQTVAYAHSRGVIHRDLKPANIMVGAFGEVQLMDWGLAKVLSEGGLSDEYRARERHLSDVSALESAHPIGSLGTGKREGATTQFGSVLGTPSYMPPEQAAGDIHKIDERSDVFSLGAILCEVLTGKPPYVDESSTRVFQMAIAGDTKSCFARLESSSFEPALIELARTCLQSDPAERPKDAACVAETVSDYLQSVEKRLRESELQRVAEVTRLREERKRQRVTVAFSLSTLAFVLISVVSVVWLRTNVQHRRVTAIANVKQSLSEARLLEDTSKDLELAKQPAALARALAFARSALSLASDANVPVQFREDSQGLVSQLTDQLERVESDSETERRNATLTRRLREIRQTPEDGQSFDPELDLNGMVPYLSAIDYAVAFREHGTDMMALSLEEIVAAFEESPIRSDVIRAFDHWSFCLTPRHRFAEFFPWGEGRSWEEAIELTRDAAEEKEYFLTQYPLLVAATGRSGEMQEACRELLERCLVSDDVITREAVCRACLIARGAVDPKQLPMNWCSMLNRDDLLSDLKWWEARGGITKALYAYRCGKFKLASECARRTLPTANLEVRRALCFCIEAMALHQLKQNSRARVAFEKAREEFSASFRVFTLVTEQHLCAWLLLNEAQEMAFPAQPRLPTVFDRVPVTADEGDQTISEMLFKGTINEKLIVASNALDPDKDRRRLRDAASSGDTLALMDIGKTSGFLTVPGELIVALAFTLARDGQPSAAFELLKEAHQTHPDDYSMNHSLALFSLRGGDYSAGIGYCRAAMALRPTSVSGAWLMTNLLSLEDSAAEASQHLKRLVNSEELSANELQTLALTLSERYANHEAALVAIERALEAEPDNTVFLTVSARSLAALGRLTESLERIERAMERQPKSYVTRLAYIEILEEDGRFDEALEECRLGCEYFPELGLFHYELGRRLFSRGKDNESLAALEAAVERAPQAAKYHSMLASAYRRAGLQTQAESATERARQLHQREERARRQQVAEEPQSWLAHFQLARNLYHQDLIEESIPVFEQAVKRNPRGAEPRFFLALAYFNCDRLDEAKEHFQLAIKRAPNDASYRWVFGNCLLKSGDKAAARAEFTTVLELQPSFQPAIQALKSIEDET